MPALRSRRAVAAAAASGLSTSPRPLLLVVEPDDQARARCATASGAGFRLSHARTGFEAIVKASCHQPDLIVMQSLVPGPDGLDHHGTVELLRRCPSTANIPIIELRRSPIDEQELLRAIEAALREAIGLP
jgi:CheY-like chemotaxis protein